MSNKKLLARVNIQNQVKRVRFFQLWLYISIFGNIVFIFTIIYLLTKIK